MTGVKYVGAEPAVTAGVASLAARDLLRGIRRHGKVLAALPHAIYLEFADAVPEPRVIAVSPPDAIRLPNAVITGPWETPPSVFPAAPAECWAGGSRVLACGLDIRIVRWWDPSPVFGPLSRARLDHGSGILSRLYAAPEHAPGLPGHDGPGRLAACCASGDLAGAVEAAEHLVGLLHCAAKGQAAAEVSAVLLGMAGQEPLEPAASRLLAAPQGADLAWGLLAGCRAALLLSVS